MSTKPAAGHTSERLAPGSYDVLRDGEAVASLVADTNTRSLRMM